MCNITFYVAVAAYAHAYFTDDDDDGNDEKTGFTPLSVVTPQKPSANDDLTKERNREHANDKQEREREKKILKEKTLFVLSFSFVVF